MKSWQLASNTYQKLEQMIQGGTLALKATRDLTCELPITVIIDTTDRELFVSVAVLNYRATSTIQITDKTQRHNLAMRVYDFIAASLLSATTKES